MRRAIGLLAGAAACGLLAACGEDRTAAPSAPAAADNVAGQGDDEPAIPPVTPSAYDGPEAWLCRPERADACDQPADATFVRADGTFEQDRFATDPEAPIDCFYVYPTVSRDEAGNADMIAGAEELEAARLQAARFGSACRIFAPLYRQVSLSALQQMLAGEEASANREMAYADILAAWRRYLAADNAGRGVVLIGHSQGAGLLARLIAAEIEGTPAQDRLVSAILIGTDIVEAEGAGKGSLGAVPACASADSTGCVIAYAAFRADSPPPQDSLFGAAGEGGRRPICVNPAELDGSNGQLKALLPASAPFPFMAPAPQWTLNETNLPAPLVALPGLLFASCVEQDGFRYLAISIDAVPADPRTDAIYGEVVLDGAVRPEWGLHFIAMNLALGNLVDVVKRQGAAWIEAHSPTQADEPQLQTPP